MASPELDRFNQPLPKISFHLRIPYSRSEITQARISAFLLAVGFTAVFLENNGYLPMNFGIIGPGVTLLAGVIFGRSLYRRSIRVSRVIQQLDAIDPANLWPN